MLAPPGRSCRNRALEWSAALIFFGIGLWTIYFPGAFAMGRFAAINDILSGVTLTVTFTTVGVARGIFLYCNGNCPFIGPVVRTLGALAGAALFSQMGLALWLDHIYSSKDASPGIVVYTVLACGELYSGWRAAGDARTKRT